MYIVEAGVVTSFTVQLEHHEIRYVTSATQCQIKRQRKRAENFFKGDGGVRLSEKQLPERRI